MAFSKPPGDDHQLRKAAITRGMLPFPSNKLPETAAAFGTEPPANVTGVNHDTINRSSQQYPAGIITYTWIYARQFDYQLIISTCTTVYQL